MADFKNLVAVAQRLEATIETSSKKFEVLQEKMWTCQEEMKAR
jgi:hypothetical protein